MGIKNSLRINVDQIARALIKSGDLDKECDCGLEYEHDDAIDVEDLIGIAIDSIGIYGEAGLRALISRANNEIGKLNLKVRATQAKEPEENKNTSVRYTDYDQVDLLCAVGSIGGDMHDYDAATLLMLTGAYTASELCRLPPATLRELLA